MRFSLSRPGRSKSQHDIHRPPPDNAPQPGSSSSALRAALPDDVALADLPIDLVPPPLQPQTPTPRPPRPLNRSVSINDRFSSLYAGDRRSIAVVPSAEYGLGLYGVAAPDDSVPPVPAPVSAPAPAPAPPALSGGIRRSHSAASRRQGAAVAGRNNASPYDPSGTPSPAWSPDFSQLPTPSEQHELSPDPHEPSMSSAHHHSDSRKTSVADPGRDRWSQRQLQRLNTEPAFREHRHSGPPSVLSPHPVGGDLPAYNSSAAGPAYFSLDTQPHPSLQPPSQPHPAQPTAYHSARTAQSGNPNAAIAAPTQHPPSNPSPSPSYPPGHSSPAYGAPLYSPADLGSHFPSSSSADTGSRPPLTQSRSYSQPPVGAADEGMSSSNNGSAPAARAPPRTGAGNGQSTHNGLVSRDGSSVGGSAPAPQGVPAFSAAIVPPASQGQAYKGSQGQPPVDAGRSTPQPVQLGDDMSEEDIGQLIKEHNQLREKYSKVKKYYFEKEDQVKQLQNSLAHQRLSQSRTSLDDSEYATRFSRLDGLVAQLAFGIRKNWVSTPHWLDKSVNKDAVATGKQEMTAVGRAFISAWLVEEVFNKYFHPDLESSLSAQLKTIQLNIRRFAPHPQTAEEEEYLISKGVNWRLSTLEGLHDALRSPQCPANREQLTDVLKERLIRALAVHLQDPPPPELEGGVHMIIELVVNIAAHLPLESRDVVIEYFTPGYSILQEQMKVESGIPPLTISVADEQAERASMKSANSDVVEAVEKSPPHVEQPKKRSMLSAITGSSKTKASAAPVKHASAGGSSSSLSQPRPESEHGPKEDAPPRVRIAAGIGVRVRNRAVLVKAPVFST